MSTDARDTCHATEPPDRATCDIADCCSVARVRLITPGSPCGVIDRDEAPSTFDACELHWPQVRCARLRNGHRIVDASGDLARLAADFPQWKIFSSDAGLLYASARLNGSPQGTTLHAHLVGQLREQMEQCLSLGCG